MTPTFVRLRACALLAAVLLLAPARADNCPARSGVCPNKVNWNSDAEKALFGTVCLNGGTELRENRCENMPPALGNFTCACCGNTLFRASDQCRAGTGWPSFTASVGVCVRDSTFEAVCNKCGAHLGDYFDGALFGDCTVNGKPSRFCIDGVCLVPPAGSIYGSECSAPATTPRNPVLAGSGALGATGALLKWLSVYAPGDFVGCTAVAERVVGYQAQPKSRWLVVYNATGCANPAAARLPQNGLLSAVVTSNLNVKTGPWTVPPPPPPVVQYTSAYDASFAATVSVMAVVVAGVGFIAGRVFHYWRDRRVGAADAAGGNKRIRGLFFGN